MNYPQRLKERIYSFIVFMLSQEVGMGIGQLLARRKSEINSPLYTLLFKSDIQGIYTAILIFILWCALTAFIFPLIYNFLVKHGYLNK